MLTEEQKQRYRANKNKRYRERYRNDAGFRKKENERTKKASLSYHHRVFKNDPKKIAYNRNYDRNRYHNNPEARRKNLEHTRKLFLKMKDDPEYKKKMSEYAKRYYREKIRTNPVKMAKNRLYCRLYSSINTGKAILKQRKRLERLIVDDNGQSRIYEAVMLERLIRQGKVNGKLKKEESEWHRQTAMPTL
jgi:hypothetical protein